MKRRLVCLRKVPVPYEKFIFFFPAFSKRLMAFYQVNSASGKDYQIL
jgi:hypothetical protein